jgi:hypothetical protein
MRKFQMLAGAGLGAMTAAERAKGRYMRAPDGHGDAEFAEFEAAGGVEVGKSPGIETNEEAPPAAKPKSAPKAPAAKAPAATPPADAGDEGDEGDDGDEDDGKPAEGDEGDEGDDEQKPKPKPKASDRIRELNKRLRQSERLRLADADRIAALEKTLLPADKSSGNSDAGKTPAPDPTDATKYPLGHLDDRYIEDKLEWLAEAKATKQADAALQREQEGEQNRKATQAHEALLAKVDDLATKGADISDDFHEVVIDAGMKGEWKLDQPTFEAATEAEHGAQILYDLSQDKTEAARVAKLSAYQQMKFVAEKDAEIAAKSKPRTKPGAGAPPETQTRGANSRTRITRLDGQSWTISKSLGGGRKS